MGSNVSKTAGGRLLAKVDTLTWRRDCSLFQWGNCIPPSGRGFQSHRTQIFGEPCHPMPAKNSWVKCDWPENLCPPLVIWQQTLFWALFCLRTSFGEGWDGWGALQGQAKGYPFLSLNVEIMLCDWGTLRSIQKGRVLEFRLSIKTAFQESCLLKTWKLSIN